MPGAAGTLSDAPDAPRVDPTAAAKVLSGEQSNTSVVVGAGAPDPLIVKLFRVLSDGPNPDVEVTSALSRAGVRAVPRVAGWVSGEWVVDEQPCRGHLAVATEFLAGSQDAWREALAAAVAGRPFTTEADELGAATASVHTALREQFGTQEATDDVRRDLVTALQERVDWAVGSSDALTTLREPLARHRERLADLVDGGVPPLQRVHGDYHLGQVLHAPGRGWVLLDFEGEPLRPLRERTRPDVALRDVVGMLRSFDYAAGHVALHTEEPAVGRAGAALGAGGADGVPGRLPAGVRHRPGRPRAARRGALARQGALRGRLRDPEPPGLDRRPAVGGQVGAGLTSAAGAGVGATAGGGPDQPPGAGDDQHVADAEDVGERDGRRDGEDVAEPRQHGVVRRRRSSRSPRRPRCRPCAARTGTRAASRR